MTEAAQRAVIAEK